MKKSEIKNILVLRFSSMGDVVLATAVFRCLRRLFPRARITAGVKKEFSPLLASHENVDTVLALDTAGRHQGLAGLARYARTVRQGKFDLVVDLHGNLRSRIFCLISGAKVLRASKAWLRRRLLVWFKMKSNEPAIHTARRYLDCLRPLMPEGFRAENPRPNLRPSPAQSAWAGNYLKKQGCRSGEALVGIAPGAAWPTKRWPALKFARVFDRLAARPKTRLLIVGGPKDLAACEEAVQGMKKKGAAKAVFSAGKTGLGELLALLARCRVLLTNDSGPMHVAVGLGVPVVALFGPTVLDFGFAPLGARDKVLQLDLSCRPCTLHGSRRCPILTHECLQGISDEAVVRAINAILKVKA